MRDLEKDLEFVGKEFKPREPICLMGVDMWVLREWLERAIKAEAENECLKRALSDIKNWCVEFQETGPHDPDEALEIVMTIYDIAHEQLGDRTEEFRVSEEGER